MSATLSLSRKFLQAAANPILVCTPGGEVILANEHMGVLLSQLPSPMSPEGLLTPEVRSQLSGPHGPRRLVCAHGGISLPCTGCEVDLEGQAAYLLVFEMTVFVSPLVEKVLNAVDDGVVLMDKDGYIKLCNHSFCRATDTPPAEALNSNVSDGVKSGTLSRSPGMEALTTGAPANLMVDYNNGRTLFISAAPLTTQGRMIGVVSTAHDMTDAVIQEKKLQHVLNRKDEYYKSIEGVLGDAGELVFEDRKMADIVSMALKVAPTEASVLVSGESGVGKEVFARLIHRNSRRSAGAFVAVNCSAIPAELMESEMFGYEPGSFTGASRIGKKGLFASAHGGTLFLDEIGEMPIQLQSKLLRAIQTKKYFPVGSAQEKTADIRIIAATNVNLQDTTKLRRDLYYRISTIRITIPPLRERPRDIPLLLEHWVNFFNAKYHKSVLIVYEAEQFACTYNWPGNVRQIRNVIERLVLLSEGEIVTLSDFRFALDMERSAAAEGKLTADCLMPLQEAYEKLEEVLMAMANPDGSLSISETARLLHVAPSSLYRHQRAKNGRV